MRVCGAFCGGRNSFSAIRSAIMATSSNERLPDQSKACARGKCGNSPPEKFADVRNGQTVVRHGAPRRWEPIASTNLRPFVSKELSRKAAWCSRLVRSLLTKNWTPARVSSAPAGFEQPSLHGGRPTVNMRVDPKVDQGFRPSARGGQRPLRRAGRTRHSTPDVAALRTRRRHRSRWTLRRRQDDLDQCSQWTDRADLRPDRDAGAGRIYAGLPLERPAPEHRDDFSGSRPDRPPVRAR